VAAAGTVTAVIAAAVAAATAAGNRAIQLRKQNREPGSPLWRAPRFFAVLFAHPLSSGKYLSPVHDARIVKNHGYDLTVIR
jgi:hypothetical protein